MNMFKLIGTASCSLMALSILVQPALAQAPNPGPGWVLVKQRTVRNFAANPAKPGSGSWQLINVSNRTYFVEDGKATRKVANSNTESQEISMGQSAKIYGDEAVQSTKPGEQLLGDVPSSKASYFEGDYLVSYKLTRYALFQDVSGYKPWTIFNQAAVRTRDVNYYLVEWTDPITSENLSEVDPSPVYTDWAVGATFNKSVASTGKENFTRRESLGNDDRKVILGKLLSPQTSLADVANNPAQAKVGTFLSNKGEGNTQVVLTGSKLRTMMAANNAVASKAKKAERGGSINEAPTAAPTPAPSAAPPQSAPNANANANANANSNANANAAANASPNSAVVAASTSTSLIDKIIGTWRLSGGSKSYISFEREGKSDNVKVKVHLDIVRGSDFDSEFTTKFGKALSNTKERKTVALTFNDDGSKLNVALGIIKATLVKD